MSNGTNGTDGTNRTRAETFARYVGLELKGRITSQGFHATAVAASIGRSPSAFNRWLNGKAEIPMVVLCEACETIGIEPKVVVEAAYDRMAVVMGERTGQQYDPEAVADMVNEAERMAEG